MRRREGRCGGPAWVTAPAAARLVLTRFPYARPRPSTDVNLLADQLVAEEPLISESRRPQLLRLLRTLAEKQSEHDGRCGLRWVLCCVAGQAVA